VDVVVLLLLEIWTESRMLDSYPVSIEISTNKTIVPPQCDWALPTRALLPNARWWVERWDEFHRRKRHQMTLIESGVGRSEAIGPHNLADDLFGVSVIFQTISFEVAVRTEAWSANVPILDPMTSVKVKVIRESSSYPKKEGYWGTTFARLGEMTDTPIEIDVAVSTEIAVSMAADLPIYRQVLFLVCLYWRLRLPLKAF
jgi:hypothetical protein